MKFSEAWEQYLQGKCIISDDGTYYQKVGDRHCWKDLASQQWRSNISFCISEMDKEWQVVPCLLNRYDKVEVKDPKTGYWIKKYYFGYIIEEGMYAVTDSDKFTFHGNTELYKELRPYGGI